jgi:hypothetical protein
MPTYADPLVSSIASTGQPTQVMREQSTQQKCIIMFDGAPTLWLAYFLVRLSVRLAPVGHDEIWQSGIEARSGLGRVTQRFSL